MFLIPHQRSPAGVPKVKHQAKTMDWLCMIDRDDKSFVFEEVDTSTLQLFLTHRSFTPPGKPSA
jgi:hypothetical protein